LRSVPERTPADTLQGCLLLTTGAYVRTVTVALGARGPNPGTENGEEGRVSYIPLLNRGFPAFDPNRLRPEEPLTPGVGEFTCLEFGSPAWIRTTIRVSNVESVGCRFQERQHRHNGHERPLFVHHPYTVESKPGAERLLSCGFRRREAEQYSGLKPNTIGA
jgi:hypothetical protein